MKTSTFERSSEIAVPASALRDWHFAPRAFHKLSPPWENAKMVETYGELTDGCRAVIELKTGPIKLKWVAIHEITEAGFIDRQESGPFSFWEHHHQFLPLTETTSKLVDTIHYRLPFGWLGNTFGKPFVIRKLDRMFRYRHEVTQKAFTSS